MRRISALGLAAVFAAACSSGGGGGGGPGPAATLVSIAVTPATAVTVAGATVKLTATGTYDDGGTRDVTAEASWSSSNAGVAQVSAAVATGVVAGTATVIATIGAIQGTAQITVDTPAFVSLRADPASATISAGQSVALRCIGTTDKGLEIDVTAAADWMSADPLVATVARGVVSGVKVGSTDVRATYAGLSTQARVTVEAASLASLLLGVPSSLTLAVGYSIDARAFAVYSDGTLRDVTLLADWSSSAPAAAEVSSVAESAGRIRTLAPGASTIVASFGGKAASAELTVAADSVIFVLVDPVPSPLPIGVAHPLRATALHADGTSADVTALATWSSDSTAATVNAAGVARAVAGGLAAVSASYGGAVGLAAIAVTGDAPSGLELGATAITLGLGDYTWPPPTVKLRYADGSTYDVSNAAELSVADSAVGVVGKSLGGDRVVRAVGLGTTSVEARYAGLSAVATLEVTPPSSFVVNAPASVPAGVSWRVKAVMQAQGGTESGDVTEYAEWSSSVPEVIAISNAPGTRGAATVVGSGSATLTATFAGYTASKTITVLGPLQSITISPATLVVPSGNTRYLSATGHLAGGGTADVTTLATWRCDRSIGTMLRNSNFWASGEGTGAITAAIGDVLGSATAVVERLTTLRVRLSVRSSGDTLVAGHTAQLRAVYVYSVAGQDVDVPVQGQVTWTSDAPTVAAFDDPASPGRVRALAAGEVYVRAAAKSPAGTAMNAAWRLSIVDATTPLTFAPVTIPLGGSTPLRVSMPPATWTPRAAIATFESSDPTIIEVRGATAVARKLGTVELRARLDDVTLVAQGTVVPATKQALYVEMPFQVAVGTKSTARAYVGLENGDRMDVTTLATWSCTTPELASMTWTPGTAPELQAFAAGTVLVDASWNGLTATGGFEAYAIDVQRQATNLAFDAPSYEVPVGGSVSIDLREMFPSGPLTVNDAVVTLAPADVASLEVYGRSAEGVRVNGQFASLTGLKIGSAVLTATWGGKTAKSVVNVTREIGEFYFSRKSDGPFALHPHERLEFSAIEWWPLVEFVQALAWTSSNPAVLKAVAPGVFEGVAPGTVIVTAASGLQVWPRSVTVSSAPMERLELTGVAPTLAAGASYRFDAKARWADGASLDVTSAATWWSADPTIAEFDPAVPGRLVAKRAGTVRIEARIDGAAEPAEVTVF